MTAVNEEHVGHDVLLLVNTGTEAIPAYEAIGSQRDATFDENSEEINTSSKNSRAFQGRPGRYKATVSLDHLFVPNDAAYQRLRDANRDPDGEMIMIARQQDGGVTELAEAFVTAISDKEPDQAESVISVSITISGFWTEVGS